MIGPLIALAACCILLPLVPEWFRGVTLFGIILNTINVIRSDK